MMNIGAKQINLEFLLKITDNNKKEIRAFIDDVIKLKNEVLPEMNRSIYTFDYLSLKQNSHKLRSAIKIFGSSILEEKLAMIEINYKESNSSIIQSLIDQINMLFPEWEKELEMEFSRIS